MKTKPDHMHW